MIRFNCNAKQASSGASYQNYMQSIGAWNQCSGLSDCEEWGLRQCEMISWVHRMRKHCKKMIISAFVENQSHPCPQHLHEYYGDELDLSPCYKSLDPQKVGKGQAWVT